MKDNDEHIISEREKRAWQNSKNRSTKKERRGLTIQERIEFLKLVAQMASSSIFERKLGLNNNDIKYWKKLLNVETSDEARMAVRKLEKENLEKQEARLIEENQKLREAEATANKRLEELQERRETKPKKVLDGNKVRAEDAARQRKWAEQQSVVKKPAKEWNLPLAGSEAQRKETIDKLRRDIMYHGLSFCYKKYGASAAQIKYEAERLGLKINWDVVRK